MIYCSYHFASSTSLTLAEIICTSFQLITDFKLNFYDSQAPESNCVGNCFNIRIAILYTVQLHCYTENYGKHTIVILYI